MPVLRVGRGSLVLGLALALTCTLWGMVVPAASAAVVLSDTPVASWGVSGGDNPRVYATAVVGGTAYVGGSFTSAVSPTGQEVPRNHLAAFDMSTGSLLSWDPGAGGTVRSLAGSGNWLYVGGSFGQLGGQSHKRLGRVALDTGRADPGFSPSVGGTVRAIEPDGSTLFIGGAFNDVDGQPRVSVAKVDADSGALDQSFVANTAGSVSPTAEADRVDALALSPSGSTLYVAGNFDHLSNQPRAGLGAVDSTTGAATSLRFPTTVPVRSLTIGTGALLYAGDGGKSGVGPNAAVALSTTTGKIAWSITTQGDIQAIDYYDGEVYLGFHEGYRGNLTTKLLAADASTGMVSSFRPVFNHYWGVYAIDAGPSGLSIGGDFTTVSGVRARNWARFPSPGTGQPPVNMSPSAAFTSTAKDLTVQFDASGSTDLDGSIATYAWDFGDGSSGTGVKTSHTYAKAGDYKVTLTVTDNQGATGKVEHDATAADPPNAAPSAAFTSTAKDLTVQFDASGSTDPDGSIATYAWDFGDGSSGTGVKTSHTYAKAGDYKVTLTVTDNQGATGKVEHDATATDPPGPDVRWWGGRDRYDVAARTARAGFPTGARTVFVASGQTYYPALAAAPAAARRHAPVLLTRRGGLPQATQAALTDLAPDRIYVVGDTDAVSQRVVGQLRAHARTTRISGGSRYALSVALSKRFWRAGSPVVFLTSGHAVAQLLSGGALAAHRDAPVLLSPGHRLPAAVRTELRRLDPERVVFLGDRDTLDRQVSRQVHRALRDARIYRKATAPNRYAVSAAVARLGWDRSDTVFLTNGGRYGRELTSAAAAAGRDAPLLLTRTTCMPRVVADELEALQPRHVVVIGGRAATADPADRC